MCGARCPAMKRAALLAEKRPDKLDFMRLSATTGRSTRPKNCSWGGTIMRPIRKLTRVAGIALAGASAAAIAASAFAAEYKMTVNRDRLINAQNEPQNWLMMNGDYGSMRYSKLTQINRDTVKNLRMVWALALGGMQDIGQNGPENEVNPLIDNGFMYT